MNILPRFQGVSRHFRPRQLGQIQRCVSASCRNFSTEQKSDLKVGGKIHGYTVEKIVPVPEFYLTAIYLSHDKTGAQHLHIDRQDSDNVFGVAFRTTPRDSTGVPHILEHTALCGSQKYPVRDPFFKMLNRSLSTFMNAFTASDWTMYPFSTQNPQDYRNLMSVYLDAAFVPKLSELDFRQEGWRLEHTDVNDKSTPIIFKGVVYNEMKGVFSNSQQVFAMRNQSLLLPSHTYGVVSGGDPANIPQLSWQQLRDFHKYHYHPSNSRFYTYGDFPLEEHLQFINEGMLDRFDKISPDTEVKNEPRWTSPRESAITCAPDPMAPDPNKQTTIAVSYLLEPTTSIYESYILNFISTLLVDGEKAPFYRALIESNIGSDYSPVIGYDGYTKEASFSVGLQGIHDNDIEKVKEIIEKTFEDVIENGFEKDRIAALLHKIELNQKHQSSRFGLNLGVQLIGSWIHDADVTENIQVTKYVDLFKKNLAADPQYLQKMVKKYFKDNNHKLTLVMGPDDQFESKRQEQEKQMLQGMVENLSSQDKEHVFTQGQELIEVQNKEEDLSCLPTLKIMDIPSSITPVDTEIIETSNIPIQLSAQPTNGVVYFRAISNIAGLDEELKPYVPLFTSVVTKMGAGMMDYRELSQQIDLHTGGMSASPHICDHSSDSNMFEQGIVLSSYCLDRNLDKMMNLWGDIFNGHPVNLGNTDRLKTLIMMSAAELSSSIVDAGHAYAMTHSASSLTASSRLKEEMSGMAQVSLMKNIAEMSDLSPIIQNMKTIGKRLLVKDNLRCSINATPKYMEKATTSMERFINKLNNYGKPLKSKFTKVTEKYPLACADTHFALPFQVHYMSRSVRTVPYTNRDFACLRILGRLMTNKFLHREIREKGGAYGGGARSGEPGVFSFYSYRDPNSMRTLEAFDNAVSWANSGDFTQQDLDEAKLAIFAQVDAPVPPGSRGVRQFLYGIDDDMRQGHRQQLFTVSKEDIIQVTDKYLSPNNRNCSTSFLGPENEETKNSKSWKVISQS